MATITKKATSTVEKSTAVAKKMNKGLVNASLLAIDTAVKNGEKWQKLTSKLIKKSEKVRNAQINMAFDTADAVKGQVVTGTKRMKDLVGFDAQFEKVQDLVVNNPVSRKVVEVSEDVTKMVSENPIVKKAEKTTSEIKAKGMAILKEAKEDVIGQATKLKNLGEAKLNDIKEDAANYVKGTEAKVAPAKKTVAKKTTTAKKIVAKKVVAKKTVAKKVVAKKPVAKKVVAKVSTPAKAVAKKTVAKAPVAKVEVKATETAKAVAKNTTV
jgi:hypothetical protein